MSLATASNWFWNWAIAFAVPYISQSHRLTHRLLLPSPRISSRLESRVCTDGDWNAADEGQGNLQTRIAFIWFATSFGAAIWTYFCVPETKGHSLEELDEMFASGIPFRKVRLFFSSRQLLLPLSGLDRFSTLL